MKALANKPTNPAELLRRGLALVLDDAFITATAGNVGHPSELRYRLNAKDWDELVERLASVAERLTTVGPVRD